MLHLLGNEPWRYREATRMFRTWLTTSPPRHTVRVSGGERPLAGDMLITDARSRHENYMDLQVWPQRQRPRFSRLPTVTGIRQSTNWLKTAIAVCQAGAASGGRALNRRGGPKPHVMNLLPRFATAF